MPRVKGFTLIELMIAIAILGIIVGLAAPAMSDFAVRQRVSGQASEIMLALAFARSEAVKQNREIVILPNINSATGWSNGWCVGPASGANEMSDCEDPDRLRDFSASTGVTITSAFLATSPRLTFQRDGTCSLCGSNPFNITSANLKATGTDARCVSVTRQGRASLTKITRDASC